MNDAYKHFMEGAITVAWDNSVFAYSVTLAANASGYVEEDGVKREMLPGTWYLYHEVTYIGIFAYLSEEISFVIEDACSKVKVKSLTTINGNVMSNYAHDPTAIVFYDYTTANVE